MNIAFYGYHWKHFLEYRRTQMAKISIRSEDILKVETIKDEGETGYKITTPFAQYYTHQDVLTLIEHLKNLNRKDE